MIETLLEGPGREESIESNLETSIENVQSFDDLFLILESVSEFPGSSKVYSREEIISVVNEARETGDISRAPRTLGLRKKLGELLESELLKK